MELLKAAIQKDGRTSEGKIIKVDMFLNHQIDVDLLNEIGKEFYRLFKDCGINRILTVEASGIGIACITAQYFHVPVVFAKKEASLNVGSNVFSAPVHSYTREKEYEIHVSKDYLHAGEKVLILDDFLARGQAILGLDSIVRQAGAVTAGVGIVIEKGFQDGGRLLREKGLNLRSLAVIDHISDEGEIRFR